ncbi:MAG: class I SAM-dependent methyltransferase [Planctomycetes bacterium]|nr:class I SAM-dependent methyltransferase [Planctomycetota bacterium]
MRESIKQFVEIVAGTLSIPEPIYEFGSLQVPGQEGFADLRPLFAGKEYVGCDMQEGPGVDRILNLHKIDLPSETAGTVLMLDTLEHVEFVRKATEEAHRILKPDGILVISSIMNFPIHDYPYDYWRFTPEAFKSLLKIFGSCFVDFAGDEQFPHTVVGVGLKGEIPKNQLDDYMLKLEDWKKRWHEPAERTWETLVKWITPPILIDIYRRIRY